MTDTAPVGVLIVTHGRLGQELVSAASTIVGEVAHMEAISIGWNDDVEKAREIIEQAVDRVDQGRGVIVLTDMFGGTPSNIAFPLHRPDSLEIITGVNLPMVVKLANQSGKEQLPELAARVKEQGKKHISIASEVLGA